VPPPRTDEPTGSIQGSVGLADIPESTRTRAALAAPDYVDRFAIDIDTSTTSPEGWARVLLEETPAGRSAPMLWRLLGLRLGPRGSAEHIQGWRVAWRSDEALRLEASTWYMTAHAVLEALGDHLAVSLFIRYDNALARVIWPPAAVLHRRGVPQLLRQAAHRRSS
jgi:hypothetical protein